MRSFRIVASGILSVVPVCVLILAFAQRSVMAAPEKATSHLLLATSGDPAPSGGKYRSFSSVRLNARSQVAFDAFLSGPSTTGVFVVNGATTSTVALGGDPDPTTANFGFVNNAFITDHGDVLFDANFTDTFKNDGRVTTAVARNGDPAPGGGTLTPFEHAANGRGTIGFLAGLLGATAGEGIFRTDGTNTVTIVRDDGVAPTGGAFTSFGTPAINIRGQVAFVAQMTGGAADFAILRGDGADLSPVFVANQIAPGGATFQDFGDPLINKHGQVAVVGMLTNAASRTGLFVGDGIDAVAVALEGQSAPKGGAYSQSFFKPLTFNDRSEVAFQAGLKGGTSNVGIFRGDGNHTTVVALAGTSAPGTAGTFASFGDMKLGQDGRVAFIATLVPGVGGVDSSNNMGIWIGTSDTDLELVARTGDVIGSQVLSRLPRQGLFGQLDMNEEGVVWVGTFASGASSVVFSRFPQPDEGIWDRSSVAAAGLVGRDRD